MTATKRDDPGEVLREFLALVNDALAPLAPFFAAIDEVIRVVNARKPPDGS